MTKEWLDVNVKILLLLYWREEMVFFLGDCPLWFEANFFANLLALSQHLEWTPWDQPLCVEPELPAGSGGPHSGGQQQQLQRDLRLHAHPQSAHDYRQQAGRLTPGAPGVQTSVLSYCYICIYFFLTWWRALRMRQTTTNNIAGCGLYHSIHVP